MTRNGFFPLLFALLASTVGTQGSGLGKDFHVQRRARLLERAPTELMLFRGLPSPRAKQEFRQDDTFWYLTGIESPDAALLLDARNQRQVLFLPRPDPARELREGPLWDSGDRWIEGLSGFTEVVTNDPETNVELLEHLQTRLQGREEIGISIYPSIVRGESHDRALSSLRQQAFDRLDGRLSRAKALADNLEARLGVRVIDVSPTLKEMRFTKTPAELRALGDAARAASLALAEAMRSTRPGGTAGELRAILELTMVRAGAEGPAFRANLQSGARACQLQLEADGPAFVQGELLVVECGAEVDHYASNLTRTWPIGGSFSERQAELYDAVLEAQKAGLAVAKPGALLVDIDAACTAVLKERGFYGLRRHFSAHLIGLEPVDPTRRDPLRPGSVIAIGPGLYDRENGIACRIEDVVLITPEGASVLSDAVPRERAEIEALVRAQGVVDWLEEREL